MRLIGNILQHKNIHLYSINDEVEILSDLNNYKDVMHYGSWINSLMIKWMHDGKHCIDANSVNAYRKREYEFITNYKWENVSDQIDYEADAYAGALMNHELTGALKKDILNSDDMDINLSGANYVNEDERKVGIECANTSLIRMKVDKKDGHNYLCFVGQRLSGNEELTLRVYDKEDNIVKEKKCQMRNMR